MRQDEIGPKATPGIQRTRGQVWTGMQMKIVVVGIGEWEEGQIEFEGIPGCYLIFSYAIEIEFIFREQEDNYLRALKYNKLLCVLFQNLS